MMLHFTCFSPLDGTMDRRRLLICTLIFFDKLCQYHLHYDF
uniref:Uncharacterized protein n=1 Tax=Triticum urartu TaxID=4572 RepID=A0A8R7V675_TRIUA